MPDLREGCATGKPSEETAPADALVLFGAMGDLAHKKIFPALHHMVRHGHLDVPVIGLPGLRGRTNISKRLVEPLKIALDMRPQQLLHAVVGELRFEFGNRALWIA